MTKTKSLYVELTNSCNKLCSFCFQSTGDMTRSKGMMHSVVFDKVLTDAKKNYSQLIFHHSGESMLHPNALEMIQKAKDAGYKTAITTNGTIKLDELCKVCDQVNISLGEKQHADVVISPIGNWVKLNPRRKMSWGGIIKIPTDNLRFYIRKFIHQLKLFLHLNICDAIDTSPAVLWDGTVVPCCLDFNANLRLGNVMIDTLDDIICDANWIRGGLSGKGMMPKTCVRCKL